MKVEAVMITTMEYQNFKSLKNVRCDLTPITVIVGPNGSGKTSMLQGMFYLSQLSRNPGHNDVVSLFSDTRNLNILHSSDGVSPLLLSCSTKSSEFSFKASTSQKSVDRDTLAYAGWFGGAQKRSLIAERSLQNPMNAIEQENEASDAIRSLVFLQLESETLAKPSYSEDVRPRMESSGEGLASVLAAMALSEPEVFDELLNRMKCIVPLFRRIRFRRTRIKKDETEIIRIGDQAITRTIPREYLADTLVFDFENRSDIPGTNVSEGTMLALGLLTVLHTRVTSTFDWPRIVLLDDIEKGLHPSAQRELVGLLREILRDQPDLQIVATSHSPYFLDFLEPSEVRLMATGPDGFSRCGLLTDHPDFPKWKDEMTPGEMWSFFGEKWLVEEKV
jgi:predicted ATPase